MTSIAMGSSSQLGARVLELMHEFRRHVFIERLGWSLPLHNGRERDQYDTAEARYVVVGDEDRVTGCARLLPTTCSYMLPELFPQLLGPACAPKEATTWELSRFATSVRETHEGRILSLSKPTLDLLDRVFDCARECGAKRLLLVTSIAIERLMLRAGLAAHRLAPPAAVDGSLCVALYIDVPAVSTEAEHPDVSLQACA